MNAASDSLTSHSNSDRYLGHNLIFIISQPKAGSTLLQRILAGHPDIQTSAETWLMLHPVYGLRSKGIETDYRANWAATGVREFLENYADGEETYRDGIRSFASTIYGRVLDKHQKKFFLDKTPRYTMIVPELKQLFPAAKFILLLRNPLAILASEIHTYVEDDWNILSQFQPDLVAAPARLVAARNILGEQAMEIRYEELVTEPEKTLQDLCGFLGVPFDPRILDYSQTAAPLGRMNDPVGIHRHTRPSTESLDKWKQLGIDEQLRHFALSYIDMLGDQTISDLGYDPQLLRSEIRNAELTSRVPCVYPWDLAIVPRAHWRLRQQLAAAFCSEAQKAGRIAGIVAACKVLLERFGGGARRLAMTADESASRRFSSNPQNGTNRDEAD